MVETKYHNPETIIPFDNIPSHLINEIFTALMNHNWVNVKTPPDGKIVEICISNKKTAINELVGKIAEVFNASPNHIRLMYYPKEGKPTVASGFSERLLSDWIPLRSGEPLTVTLIYFPSQPGQNYPEWPKA